MTLLLPHRYKRIGVLISLPGLALWLAMQFGLVKQLLVYMLGNPVEYAGSANYIVNVIAAIIGFFSFIVGLYLVAFSKEKIEDEMVQKTRSDSFQFAAFIQILVIIAGFVYMLVAGEGKESSMMLFFLGLVSLFWVVFITRFNYILHIRYKQ